MAANQTPVLATEPAVALQQPQWDDHPEHAVSCAILAASPALVTAQETAQAHQALALVAAGRAQVLQAGDCAESFREVSDEHVWAKLALVHGLADELAAATGAPVVRVGRLAGQFAKPRSKPVEHVAGQMLPAFRGHLVNSEEPTVEARAHDPQRMVHAYAISAKVLHDLRVDRAARLGGPIVDGPWASHDALVLDYETNLVRVDDGTRILGSTHLPWIGNRTRQPGSPHVRLLSTVANPIAVKLGPDTAIEDLRELCTLLDPDRLPGRLTLITRLGARQIDELLPPLVEVVRAHGHPAVWLCDPMHANTIRVSGRKTRDLADVIAEAVGFRRVLARLGVHAGGLHIEAAAADITECLGGGVTPAHLAERYRTLCDPRLNPEQAVALVAAWIREADWHV